MYREKYLRYVKKNLTGGTSKREYDIIFLWINATKENVPEEIKFKLIEKMRSSFAV